MYDPILVPLDGSPKAEEMIPYAQGIARSTGATLTLLRVADQEGDLATAEEYIQPLARRLGVEGKALPVWRDPGRTIVRQLREHPNGLVAMTTHGRTGLMEVVLGSVALGVVRHARRPVLIYHPRGTTGGDEAHISTVVSPLDGSDFSELTVPYAVEMAKSLQAKLSLVQVLAPKASVPPGAPVSDVVESAYVAGWAKELRREHGIDTEWEVLRGDPAEAIPNYVKARADVMLAMASHTRAGLKGTIFGSVTRECVRRARVPVLVYRPRRPRPRPA